MTQIESLREIINQSQRIVFFGGAGVSTESNIPDFRSETGIYNEKQKKYPYPPEVMLSHSFYENNPEEFFDYYFNKMIYKDAKPNKAHLALAKLEREGKLRAVITQNIDGLHQMAGSKNVLELHGSVHRNYCQECNQFYDLNAMLKMADGVPKCSCGGIIKPDVVLYEESLDDGTISNSINEIASCDCLIVGGTSLAVYPAAGLIRYFNGKNLVIINKEITPYDNMATLIIKGKIGEVLSQVVDL